MMSERESFLSAMWLHVFLDHSRGIKRAPPLDRLYLFGGGMHIDEWRQGFDLMPSQRRWKAGGCEIRTTEDAPDIIHSGLKDVYHWVNKAGVGGDNAPYAPPDDKRDSAMQLRRQVPKREDR